MQLAPAAGALCREGPEPGSNVWHPRDPHVAGRDSPRSPVWIACALETASSRPGKTFTQQIVYAKVLVLKCVAIQPPQECRQEQDLTVIGQATVRRPRCSSLDEEQPLLGLVFGVSTRQTAARARRAAVVAPRMAGRRCSVNS